MKFNFNKIKLFLLYILAILSGGKKTKPININIFIEDNIDPEFVKNSLFLVPQLWVFNFLEEPPEYRKIAGDWANFPIPVADNTIVIFDGTKRGVIYAGGCVGKSVGVARFEYDTNVLLFGLRIWHELLHAQGIDADAMTRSKDFENWLETQFSEELKRNRSTHEHSPQYQVLFYTFLTSEFVRD